MGADPGFDEAYHGRGGLIFAERRIVDHEVRCSRGFIGVVHAGQLAKLPPIGLRIKTLGVPLPTDLQRGSDVDLHEVPAETADIAPRLGIGRYQGGYGHHAPPFHICGRAAGPAHVLVAFGLGIARLRRPRAQGVSVEEFDSASSPAQMLAQAPGKSALA
jgi:hypothetical protein